MKDYLLEVKGDIDYYIEDKTDSFYGKIYYIGKDPEDVKSEVIGTWQYAAIFDHDDGIVETPYIGELYVACVLKIKYLGETKEGLRARPK